MVRKSRLIYEYMSVEDKKIALSYLLIDKEKLIVEIDNNLESYPPIVRQVLNDTLDKWTLEIKELEYDIKNNVGAIRTP